MTMVVFKGLQLTLRAIVCGKRRRPGANLDKMTADGQLRKWIIQNEVENGKEIVKSEEEARMPITTTIFLNQPISVLINS